VLRAEKIGEVPPAASLGAMKVASILAVARALQEAEVRYLVVGGVAVILHGYHRLTKELEEGLMLPLADPETLIELKNAAGRDRDLSDVLQLRRILEEEKK
jgi:hypothetical protein